MSYIVRGERIPDNCEDCKLFDGYGEECPFYAISKVDYPEKRFEKCPLEEVKEPVFDSEEEADAYYSEMAGFAEAVEMESGEHV